MELSSRKVMRMKRSGEFRRVRECGASFTGRWLVFGVWRAVEPEGQTLSVQPPRFGVVTSRKVGGAVVRNRVRRRIRHIQRTFRTQVCDGVWCVTVARFRAAQATFLELENEWRRLASRAGILSA